LVFQGYGNHFMNDTGGPLIGNAVIDLSNSMKDDSIYVLIRTKAHESQEIQGLLNNSKLGYSEDCSCCQIITWTR
jgi:hypothetical protein